MAFPKAIITKPVLITNADYQEVGQNIALVGYDELSQKKQESKGYASPRLLNWVEPYEVGGERKTLFYTEINSNIQPGEKVFIINGSYDSSLLIKKDKYKKGSDGYTVLKVDGCKIALDINYTGALPYKEDPIDDFIKVYYIDSEDTFIAANRQMTTRGGKIDYKFNYGQNSIAFIDKIYGPIEEWGRNGGVYGAPGFFVREENTYLASGSQTVSIKEQWNNISDKLVYLGSFSVALSETYPNNGRMLIMNGSFNFGGTDFKEGVAYRWNDSKNRWEADVEYSAPIISKSNFRSGTFKGKFNAGTYGSLEKKISWTGKGIWNGGTMLNSKWESGVMNSLISISPTLKAEKDQYGIPFQKPSTSNNGGFGFNYILGCYIEKSVIQNGNFIKTKFVGNEGTFSVVEEHLLGATQSFDNEVVKAFFDSCEFKNIHIKSGELKNARSFNSRFTNVKALNSYFEQSVLKDSTYVGDGVIKILGYDEWNMSEYKSRTSGTYSYINSPNSKIYKFYISKESFERMKAKDTFFIKGLKVNGTSRDFIIDFFDGRFRLSSWTAFYDDFSGATSPYLSRTAINQFYKRGYECSAFLSTPEENSYAISSYEVEYSSSGATFSKYRTEIVNKNANKGYSIDIVASRHDIYNKSSSLERTSGRLDQIPRDHNYGTDVAAGTASMPNYIGNNIDISGAYVIDADFHSGIIETSDWNSGYHINYNNDVAIVGPTSTGRYDMSIDSEKDLLTINTPFQPLFSEKPGDEVINAGDIVFLNSVDYDNRGMVAVVTLMATGSSYSTTNSSNPATLVNTKISGLTMSSKGSGYFTEYSVPTVARTGSGTGLMLDITAAPIGSVLSITYSAPISGGGSYSLNLSSSIDGQPGPIGTASFTEGILTDSSGSVTGVIGATYTAVIYASGPYAGQVAPLQQTAATGSSLANAIYVSGPTSSIEGGLVVRYYTLSNGGISSLSIESAGLNYLKNQVFRVEGGNATFSISSVSSGEITSYGISNPGEDYILGDTIDIPKPFDPNSRFSGTTASVVITGITASYFDMKGLSLEITTGTGALDGKIIAMTVSNPGLHYSVGEIFTISGGNLDALVRIDAVTGSVTRLNDTYKVEENSLGKITLSELGTQSVISGLTGGGVFYTKDAMNRWNYLSKTKIDRSKIKSGIFRRPYITRSLIRDAGYSSADKDFLNKDKIKNLMVADAIFSSNGNILSSATYVYSTFCGGSDIWNDGIIYRSVINGLTFSKGTVRTSTWIDGNFTGGTFYASRSFNAEPNINEKNYLSNNGWLYYMNGELRAVPDNDRIYNAKFAWYSGTFSGGQFYKSDWNSGNFNGGLFYNSKFYSGTINGGIIGTKNVDAADTKVYAATINNTTVENAYIYADDSSYEGLSSSTILWNDGVFNGGVFGSNNNQILGSTLSTVNYKATIGALPIKDFKLTLATVSVANTDIIKGDFEIDANITLKHTYIGDLIINLMAPNGKIINLKRKYSGGSNDNMVSSVFTSDPNAPSFDIWTAPYTGRFKFAGLIGQGVYYNLLNTSLAGPYKAPGNDLPPIKGYRSYIPNFNPPAANAYDGDRYLVVATASDPNWTASVSTFVAASDVQGLINQPNRLFPASYLNSIVEYESSTQRWVFAKDDSGRIIDDPKEGDKVETSSKETLVFYKNRWAKSYHSNTVKISDLLNSNKTVTGIWKLLVMDDAGVDIGFVDEFSLSFSYKDSYLIKEYRNTAIWKDGIFNGGQFIDLGIWMNGKFNGGKFISTYGWTQSGDYLNRDASVSTYTWQDGEFNGGEFGNESVGANSTWHTGEFNGGTFKGRLWNDGVFTYGEFKGGSKVSAVGSNIKSEGANEFIAAYRSQEYYGVWRKGTVSDKKDDFVTDKKIFTRLERSMKPVIRGKKAAFVNMLWLGGTFNHQAGEMKNSVWLDGRFAQGKMNNSAFNPFVLRYRDIREFAKDDSSIWENGTFANGEFHYSKWLQGKFISGTAVGMIWKNGVANYMNAYNVFWENGVWRNGNWNGSMFEYTGKVEDGFAREILNRGIEWSGTSSCHIWNLFESDSDKTLKLVTSNPTLDSFATDNVDDAGVAPPFFTNLSNGAISSANYTVSGSTITFTIGVDKGGATLSTVGIAYTSVAAGPGAVAPSPVVTTNINGNNVTITPGGTTLYAQTTGNLNVNSGTFTITIPGPGQPALSANSIYSVMAVAANRETVTTPILQNVRTTMPLQNLAIQSLPANTPPSTHLPGGTLFMTITTNYTDPNTPANADACGVVFTSNSVTGGNIGALIAGGTGVLSGQQEQINTGNFKSKILYSQLQANTQYWFNTWIENEAGRVYSPSIGTFTTGADVPDIVFANPGTSTAVTSLNMTVTNNGSNPLYYGFIIWSTGNISNTAKSHSTLSALQLGNTTVGSYIYTKATTTTQGSQAVTVNLPSGLSPNTSYKVIAYAIGGDASIIKVVPDGTGASVPTPPSTSGTNYFLTAAVPATVTTTPMDTNSVITTTTAILSGNITAEGGASVSTKGFVYKKASVSSYPTISVGGPGQAGDSNSGIFRINSGSIGTFNASITGLAMSEQYEFKAFAINAGGVGEGSPLNFYTEADAVMSARSNGVGTAAMQRVLSAAVQAAPGAGSAPIVSTGIEISLNSTFVPLVTGIPVPDSRYYVRWKITNGAGANVRTNYGTPEEAYTLGRLETNTPENIKINGVKANVKITAYTSTAEKGVVIYTLPSGVKTAFSMASGDFTGTVGLGSKLITGLDPGTNYAYEAYIDAEGNAVPSSTTPNGWNVNTDGAASVQRTYSSYMNPSEVESFWTLASITSGAGAYSGGTITLQNVVVANNGGSTISEYGIMWTIGSSPGPADPTTPVNPASSYPVPGAPFTAPSIGPSNISAPLPSAPVSGSIIKIRPYVTNQTGTYLGAVVNVSVP